MVCGKKVSHRKKVGSIGLGKRRYQKSMGIGIRGKTGDMENKSSGRDCTMTYYKHLCFTKNCQNNKHSFLDRVTIHITNIESIQWAVHVHSVFLIPTLI